MRKTIFTKKLAVSFVVLLAVVGLSASGVFAADMFSGTWKMNVAKSTYSPGPPPREQTVQIKAVSNGLTFDIDGLNSTGQKTHSEYTVKFDGKEYPYKGALDGKPNPNAPQTVSARKIDDYTIEVTENGKVLTQIRMVVSKDGKTRTVTTTGTNAQGQKVNNTAVHEKQ